MRNLKGFLALFATGIIFGSFSIYIRLLSSHVTAYQQIFLRNLVALVLILAIIFVLKKQFSFRGHSKLILLGFTFLFPIGVILFVLSVLQTQIITAVFGVYLGSVISSLIVGIVFFKEKLTALKLLVLTLVLTGLVIYVWPISVNSLLSKGLLLAVGTGLADTGSNSLRKYLGEKIDKFVLVSLHAMGGMILSLVLIVASGQFGVVNMPIESWLVVLIFGLSLIAVYYFTLVGFSNFDLHLGTVVLSSELFFGPLFAVIFFREYPTTFQIIGASLIMLAIVALNTNLFSRRA
ncbi:MAG TPA: DMT family transporter [Candidatus Saccharimonadales bacterium]|nr:DMT family transporter [Candidatus Saccharimonadales bacterium]